ncbi:hypothetical protein Esti_006375 [Eimeria stiedai]
MTRKRHTLFRGGFRDIKAQIQKQQQQQQRSSSTCCPRPTSQSPPASSTASEVSLSLSIAHTLPVHSAAAATAVAAAAPAAAAPAAAPAAAVPAAAASGAALKCEAVVLACNMGQQHAAADEEALLHREAAAAGGRRQPPPPPPGSLLLQRQREAAAEAATASPCSTSQAAAGAGAAAVGEHVTGAGRAAAAARSPLLHSNASDSTSISNRFSLSRSRVRSGTADEACISFSSKACYFPWAQLGSFAAGAVVGLLLLLAEQQQRQQQQQAYQGEGGLSPIGQSVLHGFWVFLFTGVLVSKQQQTDDNSNSSTSSSTSSSSRRKRGSRADLCLQCLSVFVIGCCFVFFVLLLLQCRMCCLPAAECMYVLLLLLHHSSEYLFIAHFRPADLSFDSLLINNSPVYAAVLLLSLLEHQLKPSVAAAFLRHTNAQLLLHLLLQQQVLLPRLLLQLHTFAWRALLQQPLLYQELDELLLPLQQQQQHVGLHAAAATAATAAAASESALLDPSFSSFGVYRQLWLCWFFVVLSSLGFVSAAGGLVLRGWGIWTLGEHFTHKIRRERVKGHALCVSGIYSRCRHPAYAGWFWWAIGEQQVGGRYPVN